MDVTSDSVKDHEDSADDVFTPVESDIPGASASHGDEGAQKERVAEGMVEGGNSYLPSHPEPLLPPEDPKVPPVPISLSDENYHRGNWGSKVEFLAAALCQLTPISIFTGFHYRVYSGGGLIFIVPYMLLLCVLGFPVILLSFSLGQFTSTGFLTSWTFMPMMKGFSVYVFLLMCSSMVFNNIIMQKAYSYMYVTLFSSSALPWTRCDNYWNTDTCRDGSYVEPVDGSSSEQSDNNVDSIMSIFNPPVGISDQSPQYGQYDNFVPELIPTTPSDEYYSYLYGGGLITWVSFVGALVAFVVVAMATMMGVKVVAKFCIGTLAASFMLTVALLIRSCTVPGASEGYQYLFIPDIYQLFDDRLWKSAFLHVIFLLSYAFWPCLGLASHNRFHNNSFLDTALMVMAVIFSPVMIAITVFCMNGFLALQLGVAISDVVHVGTEVLFISLPHALSLLPAAPVWSMVWFGLLALNLLGSQVGLCLATVSSILDLFGWVHSWRRIVPVTFGLCAFLFICTLASLFVGMDVSLGILDLGMVVMVPIPIIALSVSLVWLYGSLQKIHVLRWAKDVESMVGFFPAFFKVAFTFMWAIIIPAVFAVAVFLSLYDLISSSQYDIGSYTLASLITSGITLLFHVAAFLLLYDLVYSSSQFDMTAYSLSSLISCGVTFLVLVVGFIAGAIHEICKHLNVNTYFTDFIYRAALPLPQWGPALDAHRHYAGYLPRDFSPQPYHLGHRTGMMGAEAVGTAQWGQRGPNGAWGAATLPVTTPLMSPNPTTNETLL